MALVHEALVEKRGDGGVFTGTNFPTSRPSTHFHHGHKIPTIGGSAAGFLTLVIGLGLLVIGCAVAVFILLRRNKRRKVKVPHEDGLYPDGWESSKGGWFKFPIFKRKKHGWKQTHSYTDGDDEIGLQAGTSYDQMRPSVDVSPHRRPYEDPFSAQSADDLHREVHGDRTAHIDKGVAYQPVRTGENAKHSPTSPSFEGGTKFKESL